MKMASMLCALRMERLSAIAALDVCNLNKGRAVLCYFIFVMDF
ncbi:hypothetical protein ECLT68_0141 [Escherichia coli LT-68]|nr:hypothetical protein ECLT68_0141 [Escherichia coli LT-68]